MARSARWSSWTARPVRRQERRVPDPGRSDCRRRVGCQGCRRAQSRQIADEAAMAKMARSSSCAAQALRRQRGDLPAASPCRRPCMWSIRELRRAASRTRWHCRSPRSRPCLATMPSHQVREGRRACGAGAPRIKGRLNGFFKDAVLLEQPCATTRRDQERGKTQFIRYEVGAQPQKERAPAWRHAFSEQRSRAEESDRRGGHCARGRRCVAELAVQAARAGPARCTN